MLIAEKLKRCFAYRSRQIEEKYDSGFPVHCSAFSFCSCTLIMHAMFSRLSDRLYPNVRLMHLPVLFRISGSHSLRNSSFISSFHFLRAHRLFQRRMTSSQAAAVRFSECILNQTHLFNLVWIERLHLDQVQSLHRRCLA